VQAQERVRREQEKNRAADRRGFIHGTPTRVLRTGNLTWDG
jgi:hypothetical protein